jgi:hypothetical protein
MIRCRNGKSISHTTQANFSVLDQISPGQVLPLGWAQDWAWWLVEGLRLVDRMVGMLSRGFATVLFWKILGTSFNHREFDKINLE